MKKACLLLIAILLSVCGAFAQQQHAYDWDKDIDYLARELPARHCYLFSVRSEADFQSALQSIKKQKEELTDFQIGMKLQQLIASMGDSHTNLNLTPLLDKNRLLPLGLFWYSDGLYLNQTTTENFAILGHRIVSINGASISVVVDSLATLITVDNEATLKSRIPMLLPSLQILEAFALAKDDEVRLVLEDVEGISYAYSLPAGVVKKDDQATVLTDSISLCDRNKNQYFTETYIPEKGLYYIQYNRCWNRELELQYGDPKKAEKMPSFGEFGETVFRTLKHQPVSKIVFDVRYNPGGSSAPGTQFVKALAEWIEDNPDVKVYVVVGRSTFSSAILNAMDFKDHIKGVTFVGEQTAGKPNHFGEVRSFVLPSSGIEIGYSTKYFERTKENISTIQPDVVIESSYTDVIKGIDPVYEWIVAQ